MGQIDFHPTLSRIKSSPKHVQEIQVISISSGSSTSSASTSSSSEEGPAEVPNVGPPLEDSDDIGRYYEPYNNIPKDRVVEHIDSEDEHDNEIMNNFY